MPFYRTYGVQSLCPLTAMSWGYKASLVTPAQPTPSHTISFYSSASFPTAKKRENRETDLKESKKRGSFLAYRGMSLFPFDSMAELGWPVSEITAKPLQNLVSQGYLLAVELANCHVPTDPASPALVVGYVAVCSSFYHRGFGVPSHQFLCLLLLFYGLELHHLTPLGILHITTFITLCEAYMGIEPHFNLWNYFCIRFWLDSGTETVVWGYVDVYIRTGGEVDPYF
jgi:hypothetical protein